MRVPDSDQFIPSPSSSAHKRESTSQHDSDGILSQDLIDFLQTVDPDGNMGLRRSVTSVARTVAAVNWVEALREQVCLNMGMARAIAFLLSDG